jgi:hypothetical protein
MAQNLIRLLWRLAQKLASLLRSCAFDLRSICFRFLPLREQSS